MRLWIKRAACAVLACASAAAGPIDFALNEYDAAVAARHLRWKVKYELTPDPPESFRIEPYAYGGAHVTGGDLRGLMYGLLEAADQIRTTGRMKQVHLEAATPVRGIRRFASAADMEEPDSYWRTFFQTLARDRFNRFTLIFAIPPSNFEKLRSISQIASDYAVDFTLGLWEHSPGEGLTRLLVACPLIRSIEMRTASADLERDRSEIFRPLRDSGRRVALDPHGALAAPEILKAAERAGVALRFGIPNSPPSFNLDLPREFEPHSELYWLWGRAAYDRKLKPAHGENAAEFDAAARITTLLAAAETADPEMFTIPEAIRAAPPDPAQDNDWIASIPEAVADRLEHHASAKQTPPEICEALLASAAMLEKTALPDFQLLARLARFHAHREQAAYEVALFDRTRDNAALDRAEREIAAARAIFDVADSRVADRREAGAAAPANLPAAAKRLPRPTIVDVPVKAAIVDQAITVTLQLGAIKDVRTVRLHYRPADSAALAAVIEKPAAASMTFSIPGASSDLIYYFEILNRENSGWFEPDPSQMKPYHLIRIEPKP